jgi:glucose-6-phosphate isomerase
VAKLALQFDPQGAFVKDHGITPDDIKGLAEKLSQARKEVLTEDLELFANGGEVPAAKQPLDSGYHELPERLLDDYQTDRSNSELHQILTTAKRLRESVDRVVVLGIGGSYMGARALMESCCEPYFNELPKSQRGGRPRMYFAGYNVDNDSTQGLMELLKATNNGPDDRWAMVVVSKSGGTLETAAALRQFIQSFVESFGQEHLPTHLIPVTGKSGKLASLADSIGCQDRFVVPDGVGGRFSILSPVGLLPAAILGINVVELLESAATMNEHFRTAAPGENAVLDYVAVNHLLESQQGCNTRILSAWCNSLESVGLWYDQLLAESIGKQEKGALPLTVVNTRDLHSRAQQHQEGRRDKLINNLIVDSWRFDSLPIGTTGWNEDRLDEIANKTLPDIMTAAIRGTNKAYQDDLRPTTDIRLDGCNERSLGQLLQMLMLATVVEGRLLGINPYGQPGVENYKINMNQFLRDGVES